MAKAARKSSSRPACPGCGSSLAVVRIAYGYPSSELVESAHRGEVELGGCLIDDRSPQWFCESCQTSFGRASDAA